VFSAKVDGSEAIPPDSSLPRSSVRMASRTEKEAFYDFSKAMLSIRPDELPNGAPRLA
jgi:hypothetical protein